MIGVFLPLIVHENTIQIKILGCSTIFCTNKAKISDGLAKN